MASLRPKVPLCACLAAVAVLAGGCPAHPDSDDGGAGDSGADAGTLDAGPVECPPLPPGVVEGRQGSALDAVTTPTRRLVLMGGGPEVDAASTRFVEAAQGGDVLVLRASGSVDSYTPYFFSELPVDPPPSSVATLRTDDLGAGGDPAVLCRIEAAEALWLAGGDQWDYLGGWPPALHTALADVAPSGAAFGGTSAGAMVLGEAAFDAEHGGLTSATALAEPLASVVTLTLPRFAQAELSGHLVDTHFSQREREGRLLVFLARMRERLERVSVRGLGLDEEAAIVIEDGRFEVLAAPGCSAWVYEVTGTARLEPGTPLDLDGVLRVQLSHGDQGAWPLELADWPAAAIVVRDGVVGPA